MVKNQIYLYSKIIFQKKCLSLNIFNNKFKDIMSNILMSDAIIKKKRGRKPKNFNNTVVKKDIDTIPEESVNSEDEKIIFHLPITMNEINNIDNKEDMSIFLKPVDIKHKISEDSDLTESLKTSAKMLLNNSVNKIQTFALNFIGHFCSFNCIKSYNMDMNDTLTYKRESLINLLYYMTYSEFKEIIPAPHWLTLEEFGGNLTIDKFRENSIVNMKEYLVLHPPLISRQMQIEESYKLNKLKEVPIDKINKMYSEIESEYTIKRTKPIQTNQLNLETTMGLVKSKKK